MTGKFFLAATHEIPDNAGNDGLDTLELVPDAVPVVLTEPPIEDQLATNSMVTGMSFFFCCDHEASSLLHHVRYMPFLLFGLVEM